MVPLDVSLIITTYNWKEALEVALLSAFQQTVLPDEIIVADDGSGPETAGLVAALAKSSPVPLHHSWQEDKGFRLARSRNRAIARARGEYIILIDGDVILEKHFIEDHLEFRRPGCFIQGTRVLLNENMSARVLEKKAMIHAFCYQGVENRKNCLRSRMLARIFSMTSRSLVGVKTCNFAFYRHDAITVNGFNEEFIGWGREDSEFIVRLLNSGICRRNMRFNGLVYHLYHPMNDRTRLPFNDGILQKTIEGKLTWCEKGLSRHLDSPPDGG
ncbi:MAG: glycosyltransferase family 2 protein [Desulfobulbaceae bacterium]